MIVGNHRAAGENSRIVVVMVVHTCRDSCALYNGLIVGLLRKEGRLLRAVGIIETPRVCDFEIGTQMLRVLNSSRVQAIVMVRNVEGGTC